MTRARWRDGDDLEHLSELSRPVICEYPFNHFVSMFITFDLIKIIFIHAALLCWHFTCVSPLKPILTIELRILLSVPVTVYSLFIPRRYAVGWGDTTACAAAQ